MTNQIIYCANGCTKRPRNNPDEDPIPVTTTPPSMLCDTCEEHLRTRLKDIPDRHAHLPIHLLPGTTIDENPDQRTTTRTTGAAPMRLDVVDLLDDRTVLANTPKHPATGRLASNPIVGTDRRGTLGTLHPHAQRLREVRGLDQPLEITVAGEADLLARHTTWLLAHDRDWIHELSDDIARIHRRLGDAIGEYRQRPVGSCPIDCDDGSTCGGPLMPVAYGAVRCPRCATMWTSADLRRLGLILTETATA